jgi:hypothetical protein
MRSTNARASIAAAEQLLNRAWSKPSQDIKLNAELSMNIADIVCDARTRVLSISDNSTEAHSKPINHRIA